MGLRYDLGDPSIGDHRHNLQRVNINDHSRYGNWCHATEIEITECRTKRKKVDRLPQRSKVRQGFEAHELKSLEYDQATSLDGRFLNYIRSLLTSLNEEAKL